MFVNIRNSVYNNGLFIYVIQKTLKSSFSSNITHISFNYIYIEYHSCITTILPNNLWIDTYVRALISAIPIMTFTPCNMMIT
jgi:hypothetical protein